MRLTQFSDYSLRVLLYAAEHSERLVTISEMAEFHAISRSHLTKVVVHLSNAGFLQSIRGRSGGLRLARAPAAIRVGEVLRSTEDDQRLVECFGPAAPQACRLMPGCRLARALQQALQQFFEPLDALSLADLARPQGAAEAVVGWSAAGGFAPSPGA